MRQTSDILGVNVDIVKMNEVVEIISEFLKSDSVKTIYTPNSEIIMLAQNDTSLKEVLNTADLLIADGIGVVWASKILGVKIPERVTGFDTMQKLLERGRNGSISFYFLGGEPGIAEKAQLNLESTYPDINILGTHHGYFDSDDNSSIIDEINSLSPDVLLVALGAPRQEKWINKHKHKLNVKVCMGVGGCFDVIAGKVKRAPVIFQKLGLEWFYRLLKQPSRFKRTLKLPQFGIYVVFKKMGLVK